MWCCLADDVTPTPGGGGGPGPTTPPAAPNDPIGYHDAVNCNGEQIWGWACDPDNYNATLQIDIYIDGNYVPPTIANLNRPDIAGVCGGTTNHGFTYTIPEQYRDGNCHSVQAYALNASGTPGNNFGLTNSPRTLCGCYTNKSCTISLSGSNQIVYSGSQVGPVFQVVASSAETYDTSHLYIMRDTNSVISPAPLYSIDSDPYQTMSTVVGGLYYYYNSPVCHPSFGNACSFGVTLSSLPPGRYAAFCDVSDSTNGSDSCSGNPNCTFNSSSYLSLSCTGFRDCSNSDWTTFTVVTPSPSPTPTPTPSASPTPSSTPTPTPTPAIQGFFYEETGSTFMGSVICSDLSGITPAPVALSNSVGGISAHRTSPAGDYAGVISSDRFSINTPDSSANNYSVTLDLNGQTDPSNTWVCSCPQTVGGDPFVCQYHDDILGIGGNQKNVPFFLTNYNLSNISWWQVAGGNTYARNVIRSQVPYDICNPESTCYAGLMAGLPWNNSISNTAGFPLVGQGGSIITSDDGTNYIHAPGSRNLAEQGRGIGISLPREDYAYFYERFGASATPLGGTNPNKPASGSYITSGSITINETNSWSVSSGESIVVFVNGNLTIDSASADTRLTQVATGGYLAFIVAGNITIGDRVGYSDPLTDATQPTNTNLEGVFIADGTITVASDNNATTIDNKFIAAGTFVGWGGVNLQRTYEDGSLGAANNNLSPTETFIFRPDLVVNTPASMRSAQFTWQEINPSFNTFESQPPVVTPTEEDHIGPPGGNVI
ncbi:MAG: hypothetical protein ACOZAN_03625 [Patescibacteria group bacterium]